MTDPLGLDPTNGAYVQRQKESKMARSLEAYRNNILLRGTTLVDRTKPGPPPPVLGDDGQPLTEEKRRELAAQRTPYDPENALADHGYAADLQDHVVEELGASAEKIIQQQPEMQVVRPKELVLPPIVTEEP